MSVRSFSAVLSGSAEKLSDFGISVFGTVMLMFVTGMNSVSILTSILQRGAPAGFPRYEIPSVVGFGQAVALLMFRDMVMRPRKGYFSVLFVERTAPTDPHPN